MGRGLGAPAPQQPAESGEATGTPELAGLQALQQTPWPQAFGRIPADPWALSNAHGAPRNGREAGRQFRPRFHSLAQSA